MRRLALLFVGCAVVASLVAAPVDRLPTAPQPALAAGPGTVSISGSTITFTAGVDTQNSVDLSVNEGDAWYEFTEGGGENVIAGSGCTQLFDNVVGCPYAGISTININVGLGASDPGNAVRVLGLLSDDAVSVNGGAANDSLIAGAGDVAGMGAFTFNGGDGGDSLELDRGSGGSGNWTITSTSITLAAFGGLTYGGVESVSVYLGNGSHTVNVNSTDANASYNVGIGLGDSDLNVGAGDLGALPGSVSISAGAGAHTLTVDDSATSGAEDYTLYGCGVGRTGGFGGLACFLGGSAQVTLHAQQGSNQFTIGETTEALTINANGGDDALFAGYSLELALADAVVFNGGSGADTVELNDDNFLADAGDAYTVTSSDVSTPDMATFTYSGIEELTLVGNLFDDSFLISSATIPVLIDAASNFQATETGDSDTITVGAGDLDAITTNLRVEGGTDPDTLYVLDDFHATPEVYTFTRDSIDRATFGHLTYLGMTYVYLDTSTAADEVRIGTTEEGVYNTISSEGDDDAFVLTAGGIGLATTGSTTLDGGPHLSGDSLTVYDGGLAVSDNGTGTITTAGRQPIFYSNIENRSILPSTDTDGDGCSDVEEGGDDPVLGGDRDPLNVWDFYDVNANKAVDLNDALDILGTFGLGPLDEGYVESYDRVQGPPGKRHRTAKATGEAVGITLEDALANLASFGHSCA